MRHGIGKSSHAASAVRRQAVSAKLIKSFTTKHGEVSERFKEHAWKACVGEILPWVRIPPSPPTPTNSRRDAVFDTLLPVCYHFTAFVRRWDGRCLRKVQRASGLGIPEDRPRSAP